MLLIEISCVLLHQEISFSINERLCNPILNVPMTDTSDKVHNNIIITESRTNLLSPNIDVATVVNICFARLALH